MATTINMKQHYSKSILLSAFTIAALLPGTASAQGTNDGLGGDDGNIESLYTKITNIEKKQKALNFYVNFAESFQAEHSSKTEEWTSRFYNKNLRIEMTGWLTDNLYYRFRHRLNKSDAPMSEDNFAKATDYIMVGWKFNDTWSIQGGKKCQALGSFEFDENPMFIYQFSDMEDNVDSSKGALNLLFNASKTQQFSVEVSNTYNGKLTDEFGADAKVTTCKITDNGTNAGKKLEVEALEKSNSPLTYSLGWNGKFFDNKLLTRWSYSLRNQAKGKYSRFFRFGQKLNLSKLQWYVDYNNTYDDLDRMKIASKEVVNELVNGISTDNGTDDYTNLYLSKVCYQGIVTKMNWQFAKDWNLMLKGMWETASATKDEKFKNYRTAYGYIGSLEYYPARKQKQDLRLFLAYVGRKYDYSKKCGLKDYNTDRIELGMMYRLKAY